MYIPCDDTRLALKVTFKDGVADPKIKIVDDHSVSISEVEHCEVVKEESTKFVERYYEVEGGISQVILSLGGV